MEKFQTIAEEWLSTQRKLRNECIKFLKKVLKKNGNHLEWDDSELDSSVCISYNGGGHPEYASNCFSTLIGINMDENGNITFDIEDCSGYELCDVPTDELYDVCDFVDNVLLAPEEEEK